MSVFTFSNFLSLLVVLAGSTVASTLITTYVNRNKLDADMGKTKVDGAAVLSAASIAQVQMMTQQIADLRAAWLVHREWDKAMVRKSREHGIEYDDPPDLWI